jgi:hypothetical protein
MKLLIMGIFLVPALIFMGVGLLVRRSQKWKHDIAVVFLSVSAAVVFMIFSMVCALSSQEIIKLLPPSQQDPLGLFHDYFTGAIFLLALVCAGLFFLGGPRKNNTLQK